MEIIGLTIAHVESAAEVLADVHGQQSGSRPMSSLSDRNTARRAVSAVIGSGPGVVAVDGSSVVGYMVAPLPAVPGPATTRLGPVHHAARPSHARPAYRQMYSAIAGRLVAAGCTYHSLPLLTTDPAAIDTFFELEFGVDQITGATPIGDLEVASAPKVDVRMATGDDIDELVRLAVELTKFHSRTPTFQAALLDVPTIRQSLIRAIDDHAAAVLVADDGERLAGMVEAQADDVYADSVKIGMKVVTEAARSAGVGTAMLDFLFRWAARSAYQYCTVNWTSSNLISDTFYRSRGFTPIRHRLHRRIDSRVAWANDTLDYSSFPLR